MNLTKLGKDERHLINYTHARVCVWLPVRPETGWESPVLSPPVALGSEGGAWESPSATSPVSLGLPGSHWPQEVLGS